MPENPAQTNAMQQAFDKQIAACRHLGSPFTAAVIAAIRDQIDKDAILIDLLGQWPGEPLADAVSLRMTGVLHALVLSGEAPELAKLYPPNPMPDVTILWPAIRNALEQHLAFVREFMKSPPQTNEVSRSSVLLGGFLEIARATQLPLNMLEIGASAGLNLNWDLFHYNLGGGEWGDAKSPVQLEPDWKGALPPLDASVRVIGKAGCDIAPVDLGDAAARQRLQSYVWPDQPGRLQRLAGAIALAQKTGNIVAKANAGHWLEEKLATRPSGAATVIYHSIMWQYMPASEQADIKALIARTGMATTPQKPLAWLRFEPDETGKRFALTLLLWPGGEKRVLANGHPHGASVEWLGA